MIYSSFTNQKDNYKPLLIAVMVAIIIYSILLLIFTFNTATKFVLIIPFGFLLSIYYTNYNRYCDICKRKMQKDFTHGLGCEVHYCVSCKRKIEMKILNERI